MFYKTGFFALACLLCSIAPSRANDECTDEQVAQAATTALSLLKYTMDNGEWEKMAHDQNLDPYSPHEKVTVPVPCKYFGKEFCGVQASTCKESKVTMTLQEIAGLSVLTIDELLSNAAAPDDGTCPYKPEVNFNAENFWCGFHGSGEMQVSIPGSKAVNVEVDNLEMKVKCHNSIMGTWWETPYKTSSVKCALGGGAYAKAGLNFCGALCNKSLFSSSFKHLELHNFSFHNYEDTLKCSASGTSQDITDKVMGAIESAIIGMFGEPVQDMLNDLLDSALDGGVPTKCEEKA